MKPFIVFVLKIFLVFLFLAISLDLVYTYVYETASPRNKFQYFRSFKNKRIDYIFLGSSRVENSIVSKMIENQTGKKVLNLGFQAAKMQDIYRLLKMIKEYNIDVDKVFIQVDYIYNVEEGYSNILPYEIMPYIRDNNATKEYVNSHFKDAFMHYYFPFYRYTEFDSKIGFREFILNVLAKKTAIQKEKGFIGLQGELKNSEFELPYTINAKNIYLNKVQQYAKNNNLEIVYYFAPMSLRTKNKEYISKLKSKIPALYDFSSVISDDKLFKDCTHLNQNGAIFFTQCFIDNMLIDK